MYTFYSQRHERIFENVQVVSNVGDQAAVIVDKYGYCQWVGSQREFNRLIGIYLQEH